MEVFEVGGAVRDELLGRQVCDRDFVVVGSTPEAMVAQGFRPVGRDFPVFLHPETHEEYALARTERKTGRGYTGFQVYAAPDVTLTEDLARRDLTINAMARDANGALIDPFGGQRDLEAGILRHVSDAFTEDPVRILRLARFAARFAHFTVAEETLALMKHMVDIGEVDHLVPERVWAELAKGLMESHPSRMLAVLQACGALARIMPELSALYGVPQPPQHHPEVDCGIHMELVVDQAAAMNLPLAARFAALTHDAGKGTTPPDILPHHYGHEARGVALVESLCARLKVPTDPRDLAIMVCREHGVIHAARELRANTVISLYERCDAFRRPERFLLALAACVADSHGRPGHEQRPYLQREILTNALNAIRNLPAGDIARQCTERSQIPLRLHEARVQAVKQVLGSLQHPTS